MDEYRHYRMALRNLSVTWALYLAYDGTQQSSSIDYVLTRMAPPADDRPLPEVNARNVVALVRHRPLPDPPTDVAPAIAYFLRAWSLLEANQAASCTSA